MRYSACIEWLFADANGLPALPGTAEGSNPAAVKAAFPTASAPPRRPGSMPSSSGTGRTRTSMRCRQRSRRPGCRWRGSSANRSRRSAIRKRTSSSSRASPPSVAAAQRLGAKVIIARAGDHQAGVARIAQHAAIVKVLKEAAKLVEGSGVVLGLEPLERPRRPSGLLPDLDRGRPRHHRRSRPPGSAAAQRYLPCRRDGRGDRAARRPARPRRARPPRRHPRPRRPGTRPCWTTPSGCTGSSARAMTGWSGSNTSRAAPTVETLKFRENV